jgi:hypothetical protein
MKLRNSVIVIAAVAMGAMLQTAQASIKLGDLVSSGGSITYGDKTFSNFSWQNSDGLLNSQAANLIVTASVGLNGAYYLDFGGGISLNNRLGTSDLIADLKLVYTVTVNNPGNTIVAIDQDYTGNGIPSQGQVSIGETVKNPLGIIVGLSSLTLDPWDPSDPKAELGDVLNFPGEQKLTVVKDIQIDAFAGTPLFGLSDVEQSFHQVPEPTTMLAGALLLLPLGASTLRIMRRNRMS